MVNSCIKVVALVGSATDPDQILRSALADEALSDALATASGRQIELKLVSWLPSSDIALSVAVGEAGGRRSAMDRLFSLKPPLRFHSALQKFPAGRLINSLGPLDQSRIFWRTVRKNELASSALSTADVLLAVDLPAVRTAWIMRRKNPSSEAYFGIGSTLKVFANRFAR